MIEVCIELVDCSYQQTKPNPHQYPKTYSTNVISFKYSNESDHNAEHWRVIQEVLAEQPKVLRNEFDEAMRDEFADDLASSLDIN